MIYVELFTTAILIISILAFCVSMITQVFKGVGFLKKIPTDFLVLFLSVAITVAAFWAYMDYMHYVIIWYMVVAAVILGFMVAFIAMFGWERLATLWNRYKFEEDKFLDQFEEDEEMYEEVGATPTQPDQSK